jgi:phosphate acetyltransferase
MKTKSLYIASLEPFAGSLFVTMGVMELLKGRLGKVAFFRPLIENDEKKDDDIAFVLDHYALEMEYAQAYGFSLDDVKTMVSENRTGELFEALIRKFKQLESEYDFVLCEGLNRASFNATFDFDMNLEIAKNIGSPYINIINGKKKSAKKLFEALSIEAAHIEAEGCNHFATFVNRIDPDSLQILQNKWDISAHKALLYLLPEIEELDKPTVADVMHTLGCDHIFGDEKDLKRVVRQSKIAVMKLENYLRHIEEGDLIIVSGDRSDIIIGTLAAVYSQNFPHIAGILLTGGIVPEEGIMKLVRGLNEFSVPILSIESDTYEAAMQVDSVPSQLRAYSERKIALAQGLFASHVDVKTIEAKIQTAASSVMTPAMFEFTLFEKAREKRKKIVLPESDDERILRAAEILLRREVVDIILLGDPETIYHKSASLGLDLSMACIVNPADSPLLEVYASMLYELRREKGLLLEAARDAMTHSTYFATMMVHSGYADGMVSGAAHTTQDTIRPALQIIKTKPGISIVSSIFFMCLDNKVLVYGDCAVNLDPDAAELAEIAISSAESAVRFGIEPRIAMLSYSTGTSGKGEEVEKVREATRLAREKRPDLLIEGPIQYDAAIDPEVASVKLPGSDVAGKATIFIFPDLNTGNNTYKAVQRSTGGIAIGPVLQGLKKPVNDLSRGCSVDDIINTVAITAIQAQAADEENS